MANGNAAICGKCQSPIDGTRLFCKNCGAPVTKTNPSAAPPPSGKPSSAPPRSSQKQPPRSATTQPPPQATGTPQTALFTCRNCGGQLRYSPGVAVVRCLYCGSDTIVQSPSGSAGTNAGGEDGPPAYYEPKFSASKIKEAIIRKAAADPAGLKTLDQVSMKIEGCYFPAWVACLQVHCNWSGANIERHTVTRYRKENKWVEVKGAALGGKYVEENVPYEDTEEIAHPTSGMHDYEANILVPAAKGVTPEQFELICRGISSVTETNGYPPPTTGFPVASPTFRGPEAWKVFSGDKILEREAANACRGYCDSINRVAPVVNSRRFSVLWIPMAVASYSVQGQEYRHFTNLITGEFWGDIPADWSAVKEEATNAQGEAPRLWTKKITKGLVFSLLTCLCVAVALYCLQDHFTPEEMSEAAIRATVPSTPVWQIPALLGSLVVGLFALIGAINAFGMDPNEPWTTFLNNRYAFLARFFLFPPNNLQQRMYAGYTPAELDKLKTGLMAALQSNFANDWLSDNRATLDAVVKRAAHVMLGQPEPQETYNLKLYYVPGKGCTTDFSEAMTWQN